MNTVVDLKISEIFYSLQGEGGRAGDPSLFVRLSGCDLTCGFCDTEFESGKALPAEALLEKLRLLSSSCRWIVWTGGEPSLQLTAEAVAFFKAAGYMQAIETNGNHKPPAGLDYITCSPKVAEHVVKKNMPAEIDELRYVRHSGQLAVPRPSVKARRYFLSPQFSGAAPDRENIKHCIRLCLENPTWSLSVQTHKLLGIT